MLLNYLFSGFSHAKRESPFNTRRELCDCEALWSISVSRGDVFCCLKENETETISSKPNESDFSRFQNILILQFDYIIKTRLYRVYIRHRSQAIVQSISTMTSLQDGYLIDVDINARLAAKTIQTKILPIIHRLKEEAQENERNQASKSSINPSVADRSETRSDANFDMKNNESNTNYKEVHQLSLLQKEDISVRWKKIRLLLYLIDQ